jgi:F-type H+-transporting ATPase subunit gamma
MPSLIDLRRRIKSVRNTQQITQAMKTVATAKFKQAQRTIIEGRPAWHHYPQLVETVAAAASRGSHPLLEKRREKRLTLLVLTSDKGLAGAFNSNLLSEAEEFLRQKSEDSEVRLTLLGKKAWLYFRRLEYPIEHTVIDRIQKLTLEELRSLAGDQIREFILNQTDAVYVAYNEFKSILAPRVTVMKLLPLEPPPRQEGGSGLQPDWEPGMTSLLNALLPRFVEDQICHSYYESLAAEHAARMMAMDNATNNAEDLVDDLTLVLNKIRQASITKELLEIMSAVEALSKNR